MRPHRNHSRGVRRLIFGLALCLAIPCSVSQAQEGTPITSSGLNTTVSAPITLPSGETQFDITGGTRPGGGPNLFHSFGDFNVPNNNTANFLNNSGLTTSNILGRVTGGDISNIFGTIQTTGFGNANLFLMNPAGFLFGPNATVNVGGMVTFTSADYLRLADNARFNAIPQTRPDMLLSAAPVAAFGFLGSNQGAITVQGSHLSVAEGTGISLVGGDITVQAGTLTAPSGHVNLVSVNKPSHAKTGGEVAVNSSGQGPGFNPTGFKSLGAINLSQGSTIDTSAIGESGPSAGPITIRGGKFVMDNSVVAATTPAFEGVGGNIEVTAKHVALSNYSVIVTNTLNSLATRTSAGNITFNVGTFSATDSTIAATSNAVGGAVTIQGLRGSGTSAHAIALLNTFVSTSSNFGADVTPVVTGGPIVFRADNIALNQSGLLSNSIEGAAGAIVLESAGRITIHNSTLQAKSVSNGGGTIDLRAGTAIDLTGTDIRAYSEIGFSPRPSIITLSAPFISLNSSRLSVATGGNALLPGIISIAGRNAVRLTNGTVLEADNSVGVPGAPLTSGGHISIDGGALLTIDHSTISAQAPHHGGTINLGAKGLVVVHETLLTTAVSGGPQTVAGAITVDAPAVKIKNSQILSTATEGQGGVIEITSHNRHPVTNSVMNATSQFGTDGTVTIKRP